MTEKLRVNEWRVVWLSGLEGNGAPALGVQQRHQQSEAYPVQHTAIILLVGLLGTTLCHLGTMTPRSSMVSPFIQLQDTVRWNGSVLVNMEGYVIESNKRAK